MTYLLTISAQQLKHYISRSNLDEVCIWIYQNNPSFEVHQYSYERTGHYQSLHFHAIVTVDLPFFYSPYTQYGDSEFMHNTFRIQWKRVYSLCRAIQYVHKDNHNSDIVQHQILTENYYKHHYFNIDTQSFVSLLVS